MTVSAMARDRRWNGMREGVARLSSSTALIAVAAAAVVTAIAMMIVDRSPVGVVHDDGMYMILAKSLATGHGFRWINIPGEPRATHFPPGYPAFLSVLWRVGPGFPANVVFFKLINAVLLGGVAASVVVMGRRRLGLSASAAGLVAVAGCASIPALVLSNLVMSETLFLLLLLPALLYAERCVERETTSVRQAIALAVIGGVLMLVRSHGIAFVAAVGLMLLLRRRFRAVVGYAIAVVIVALPWHIWQALYSDAVPAVLRGDYASYTNWFFGGSPAHSIAFLGRTVASTSREIFSLLFVTATVGVPTRALRLYGTIAAIVLMVVGLVSLRRRAPVTALFLCGFFAIILVWPFTPARFVWTVWPLLVLLFVAGARAVKDWQPAARWMNAGRLVVGAGVLIVAIGYGTYNVRGYKGQWWSSIARNAVATAGPTITWVAMNTAPSDVISSNSEVMIYLYTRRLAVPVSQFRPEDYFGAPSVESRRTALTSILKSYPVGVVAVVSNESLAAAAASMAAGPDSMLVPRARVPNGLIFTTTNR